MLESVTGGDPQTELPLHVLQAVCRHVSTISKRNVPKVVAQKRLFVRGWHEDARSQWAVNARGRKSVDAAELFHEIDARLKAQLRSITQPELPANVVGSFTDQIAELQQAPAPTMLQDRRDFIREWHAQYAAKQIGL